MKPNPGRRSRVWIAGLLLAGAAFGSGTVEDIVAAFRTGHRPDRSPILPPMPWPVYGQMSDEDAYALAAFIKSVPPVRHKAPDRIPPGVKPTGARLTFPPPPEWDGRHLPKPAAVTTPPSSM